MLRVSIFVATALLAGCPSKQPEAPRTVDTDDRALRIRVAQAEVARARGIDELRELATNNDVHARELALRGLGRSASAAAIPILETALADPEPRVVVAALTAIGVLASLDEAAKIDGGKLAPLLAHADRRVQLAAAEAIGRAGSAGDQAQLTRCARTQPACALALGRYGRRKIALEAETREALVLASGDKDRELRYAATYALAREHEPPADDTVLAALLARIADPVAEIRATAIAGLSKRKAVTAEIELALGDDDWRVAVEAARALAATDEAGRTRVAMSLVSRDRPHLIHEALRAFAGKSLEPGAIGAITPLVTQPGWTGCLAAAALGGPTVVEAIAKCQLPDHLKLPLLADVKDPTAKRAALRVLLAHDDPRVRAAGLATLAGTWTDADARARQTIVSTLTSALASKNPIVAGSAVEAITTIYEAQPDTTFKAALDAAIVARTDGELDVELASALFGVVEKQKISSGLDACRKGLGGHPVRAKAATACMKALGEVVSAEPFAPQAPPVDVATVIGHRVIWHLATARGEITIELRPDIAPWAVASIVALTQRKQYDGLELHRVVPNFVAQGGDPTMSGWGGPGYTLPAEPSGAADGAGFVAGGVGIADGGPDSGGSQWFIMHSRAAHLDGRYTWVGSVTAGQAIADQMVIGDKVDRATVEVK